MNLNTSKFVVKHGTLPNNNEWHTYVIPTKFQL